MVGGPHKWVVRQNSHLAADPLEEPDYAAAHANAPPVHLALPREHAMLLVLDDEGVLVLHVPSMNALQVVREATWDSVAAQTRAHTPLVGACKVVPLYSVLYGPTHMDMLRARYGRLPTMQTIRRWQQKVTCQE